MRVLHDCKLHAINSLSFSATDLMMLDARDMRTAARVRRPGHAVRSPSAHGCPLALNRYPFEQSRFLLPTSVLPAILGMYLKDSEWLQQLLPEQIVWRNYDESTQNTRNLIDSDWLVAIRIVNIHAH